MRRTGQGGTTDSQEGGRAKYKTGKRLTCGYAACGVLFIEFSDSPPWSTGRYGMGGMGLEVLDAGLVMGFFFGECVAV